MGDFGDEQVELGRRVESALREAGFVSTLTVVNPMEYLDRAWRMREYEMFLGPTSPATGPNGFLFLGTAQRWAGEYSGSRGWGVGPYD